MPRQGLLSASGTVLSRRRAGEGGLRLTLLLKGQGLTWASAPGAERGRVRLGGGTEPFVWGVFGLYRGRSGGLYVNSVDVAKDMLFLRRRPEALRLAVSWSRLLTRLLMADHPADDVLANLYWNMTLLAAPEVSVPAVNWRFLRRWLVLWGLAPDLTRCARCGARPKRAAWTEEGLLCPDCAPDAARTHPAFTAEELALLLRVAESSADALPRAFGSFEGRGPAGGGEPFAVAARCAAGLLEGGAR